MPDSIRIVEVGPRDGLQNERTFLSAEARVEFIRRLLDAGLTDIEVGSFVSEKKVPQMKGTAEVVRRLPVSDSARYSVLVPNTKGMQAALDAGAREVAVFASASERFSQANIGCSVAESIARFRPVAEMAKGNGIPVRGYISCVLGCPFEGEVAIQAVVSAAVQLSELGCYEISLGDTIGIGTPRRAQEVVRAVANEIGIERVAGHFHDTRGQALANIFACFGTGVRVFDSAVAGLGGCPFAPGAAGNVSTEDMVFMFEGMGVQTGVDLRRLVDAGMFVSERLGRTTQSKVARAMMASERNSDSPPGPAIKTKAAEGSACLKGSNDARN
jgi:hydroxymethylglutaryl-CoA lyase